MPRHGKYEKEVTYEIKVSEKSGQSSDGDSSLGCDDVQRIDANEHLCCTRTARSGGEVC